MYKKLYLLLFNGITDAIRALEARNYGQAEELLKSLQAQAEDIIIEQDFVE